MHSHCRLVGTESMPQIIPENDESLLEGVERFPMFFSEREVCFFAAQQCLEALMVPLGRHSRVSE